MSQFSLQINSRTSRYWPLTMTTNRTFQRRLNQSIRQHPRYLSNSWNIHCQRHARCTVAESYETPLATNKASPNKTKDSWHGKSSWIRTNNKMRLLSPCSTQRKGHSRTRSPSRPPTTQTYCTGTKQ